MGLGVNAWLLAYLVIPFFYLALNVFSTTLHMRFGLSHPLIIGMSQCICNQPLDPMGIHILHYAHGGKRMASHNVVRDVFTAIAKAMRFYVLRDQTHVLLFLAL